VGFIDSYFDSCQRLPGNVRRPKQLNNFQDD
jgi:hypothetical protein